MFREWSLITGRGELPNRKIAGPTIFAPSILKSGILLQPTFSMATTLSSTTKTTPKLCAPPPFNMAAPPIVVGVRIPLAVHPLPFCSTPPPYPVIDDQPLMRNRQISSFSTYP